MDSSLMAAQFVNHNGEWAQVQTSYYGKDGEWKECRVKLVGHNGKWVEVESHELPGTSDLLDVQSVNVRAGNPYQQEILFNGTFDSDIGVPSPPVGAFYRLKTNLTDKLENFPNIILDGTGSFIFDSNNGIYSQPGQEAFLKTTEAGDGYDLLGFIGSAGSKHWEMGAKFIADELPIGSQKAFIFYAGTATQNIAVWFDNAGDLYAKFTNGVYQHTLTAIGKIIPNEKLGFVFRHVINGTSKYLELETSDGQIISDLVSPAYWTPSLGIPLWFLKGVQDGTEELADELFLTSNTDPVFNISNAGRNLDGTSTAYRASIPSGWINPGTGKYYIEVNIGTSYDVQLGVTDSVSMVTTSPPGLIGWCVNTINGRKFAKQTGGGTAWTAATPPSSTLGLLYDSDLGIIQIFDVTPGSAVARTNPFVNGTITAPVRFIIGGRSLTTSTGLFNISVNRTIGEWLATPPGIINEFPLSSIVNAGLETYTPGYISDLFLRNSPMSSAQKTQAVIGENSQLKLIYTSEDTSIEYDVTPSIVKAEPTKITTSMPNLPPGNYQANFSYPGIADSNSKLICVSTFTARTTPLHVDFSAQSLSTINRELMAAHKQWGGANGGVSADAVKIVNGECELSALGDLYSGSIQGTDRVGLPSGFNTRIGSCIVTRDYFGPGSYKVVCKPVQEPGVCNALWTFHYQEAPAGTELYDIIEGRGLHGQGDLENGFYIVENNEIDIEFPTALKSNPDQEDVSFYHARFNAWEGELRNWDVEESDPAYWTEYTDDFIDHGVNLADGNYHELRFDWHLDEDPRVEYYIDGILKHIVRTNIPTTPGRLWLGLWFPSAATQWAGRGAPWEEEKMFVKSLDIIPFVDEYENARLITESYPNDVFRDIK